MSPFTPQGESGPAAGRFEPAPALRALASRIAEGVAVCRGGRVAWASPRLAALAGCTSPEPLLGARPEELLTDVGQGLPSGDRPGACRCRFARGADRQVAVQVVRPEGTGAEPEEIWVFQDLIPGQQRDELLSVVSHELRTPITVITGYNRLLLAEEVGALNDEQRRFLRECTKSCQRLNDFIANLLATARAVRGHEIVEKSETALHETLCEVAGFLRPLADEKGIELKLACADGAAGRTARFDPLRLEQVLTNLIGNAIRYAQACIEVSAAPLEEGGRAFLEVAVADDGPGVPAEERDRIFEPWVQGEVDQQGGGGLGLGLAISRRIVEAHGGRLSVQERPGGGARFAFTLPVGAEEQP